MALITDASALKADQRHHPPQEQIDFPKFGEFLRGATAHQAIIRMAKDDLSAHELKKMEKTLRREALEECIGISLGANAIDNFAIIMICVHHRIHGIDIILSIAINAAWPDCG